MTFHLVILCSQWTSEKRKNKMEPTNPNANTFEKLHMSK